MAIVVRFAPAPDEGCVAAVLKRVLGNEGGVADVGDGMGVTRYGQTQGWLAEFGLPVPQSAADALANYRTWLAKTRLDLLCGADDILPDAVIDYAVNSGHRLAIEALQRTISVKDDGSIGPATIAALAPFNRMAVASGVIAERLEMIGHLITYRVEEARYAQSWMDRIAAQVKRFGR